MFLMPGEVANHDFLFWNLPAKHGRERDAVVQRIRLVTEQRNLTGRVVLTKLFRGRRSRETVPDDDVSANARAAHVCCRPRPTIISYPTSRARSSISKRALCWGSEPFSGPRAPTRKYAPGRCCCMNAISSDHITISCGSTISSEPSTLRPTSLTMSLVGRSLIVGG